MPRFHEVASLNTSEMLFRGVVDIVRINGVNAVGIYSHSDVDKLTTAATKPDCIVFGDGFADSSEQTTILDQLTQLDIPIMIFATNRPLVDVAGKPNIFGTLSSDSYDPGSVVDLLNEKFCIAA